MGKVPHKMGGQYKNNGTRLFEKKDFERCVFQGSTRGSTVKRSLGMQGNIMGVKRPFISSLPFLLIH